MPSTAIHRRKEQGNAVYLGMRPGDLLRDTPAGDLRNRLLGSKLLRGLVVPRGLAQAMLAHCAMEMNQLARFLPDLYDDYH